MKDELVKLQSAYQRKKLECDKLTLLKQTKLQPQTASTQTHKTTESFEDSGVSVAIQTLQDDPRPDHELEVLQLQTEVCDYKQRLSEAQSSCQKLQKDLAALNAHNETLALATTVQDQFYLENQQNQAHLLQVMQRLADLEHRHLKKEKLSQEALDASREDLTNHKIQNAQLQT